MLTIFAFVFNVSAQSEIENLLKKSEEFSRKNQLPEAIAEISKAIALKPDDAILYLQRAELNFGLPDYNLVKQDAKKALELNSEDKRVVLTAARFLRNIRECAESLNVLNVYIYNQSETDDIVYARAHSKMCLGEWIGAYEDMSRALELSPNNSHYRTTQIGLLSKIGDSQLSAEKFEQFLNVLKNNYTKADPKTGREDIGRQISEVYRTRAATFHAKGDEIAEFADLAESVKYYEKDSSYVIRGKIYSEHRMYEKAIEDYNKAIPISQNPHVLLFERGDLHVFAGKLDEAMKDYDEALKLDEGMAKIIETRKKWAAEKFRTK